MEAADGTPPREGEGRTQPEQMQPPATEPRRPSASALRQNTFNAPPPYMLGLGGHESEDEAHHEHEDDSYWGQVHGAQNVENSQRRCHSMSDLEHLEEAVWDIEDRCIRAIAQPLVLLRILTAQLVTPTHPPGSLTSKRW